MFNKSLICLFFVASFSSEIVSAFNGKVVIVTGASSGIGADAAVGFAREGATVVLVGRNTERLNKVASNITANGSSTPLIIAADVSKDAHKIINETIQQLGRIDILVNNAGIGSVDTASTFDLEGFDKVFATNVRGVAELTKLAVPHLERTKGNVVIVSSDAGIHPLPQAASYSMSKAAINMYTKCASVDLAPKGIRVNAVLPGMIKTSFLKPLGITDDIAQMLQDKYQKLTPVGRIGDVTDTTNAILFLANEKSNFINGAELIVDGGILNNL